MTFKICIPERVERIVRIKIARLERFNMHQGGPCYFVSGCKELSFSMIVRLSTSTCPVETVSGVMIMRLYVHHLLGCSRTPMAGIMIQKLIPLWSNVAALKGCCQGAQTHFETDSFPSHPREMVLTISFRMNMIFPWTDIEKDDLFPSWSKVRFLLSSRALRAWGSSDSQTWLCLHDVYSLGVSVSVEIKNAVSLRFEARDYHKLMSPNSNLYFSLVFYRASASASTLAAAGRDTRLQREAREEGCFLVRESQPSEKLKESKSCDIQRGQWDALRGAVSWGIGEENPRFAGGIDTQRWAWV